MVCQVKARMIRRSSRRKIIVTRLRMDLSQSKKRRIRRISMLTRDRREMSPPMMKTSR